MLDVVFHFPIWVTILALVYLIFMSTVGVRGEHRWDLAIGQRVVEGAVLGLAGWLMPGVTLETIPILNLFVHDVQLWHIGIVFVVVGIPLSFASWFFKHDFTDPLKNQDKPYVHNPNAPSKVEVTVKQIIIRSDDEATKG